MNCHTGSGLPAEPVAVLLSLVIVSGREPARSQARYSAAFVPHFNVLQLPRVLSGPPPRGPDASENQESRGCSLEPR